MRSIKLPQILRNAHENSITISYGTPKCSLIWLHGLNDTVEGFFPFFTNIKSPVYDGFRVKLIQAPLRRITISNQENCHAWFDILNKNRFEGKETDNYNFNDINESVEIVGDHVKKETEELEKCHPRSAIHPSHRIFVGGFSQGGIMSLIYSLQAKYPPAGAISLSGHMIQSVPHTNFEKFPVLLMNGTHDTVINEINARKSYAKLLSAEYLTDYRQIEGLEHTVNLKQLGDITKWMNDSFRVIEKIYREVEKKEKSNQE